MKQTLPITFLTLATLTSLIRAADQIEQYATFETSLTAPTDKNPFTDTQLTATFTHENQSLTLDGFYDGNNTYRLRFMPPTLGTWHYTTHSNLPALNNKTGDLTVIPPTQSNHGPIHPVNTYHLAYADNSPYFEIGTTIYGWTHEHDPLEEQTLATLKTSPFNKVRMLLLPGGIDQKRQTPILYPFEGTPPKTWDFTRFNPAFFQHLEKRIADLRDLNIQADVILFHPYDKGKMGFDRMPADADDRYVKYVVARLGSYRNVWWSLANEFDLEKTKIDADWDRLFHVLTAADPYHHMTSIHQSQRLYPYWQTWITHASLQNGSAVEDFGRAVLYRDIYEKPILMDEVRYEGNLTQRWGHLTPEQMTEYFWQGTIAGVYVTHGEAFGDYTGDSWTGTGGTLHGKSPERIAFLKSIVDTAPPTGIDPIDKWQDTHTAGKAGRYYLIYFGRETPTHWTFDLPSKNLHANQQFHLDILDTWNMTITALPQPFTIITDNRYRSHAVGNPTIDLPGKPYLALRLTALTPPPTTQEKPDDPNAP